jgi:prophage regulatory protein
MRSILRPKEAAEYLGIGLSTLYRWANERPDFPKRIRLGPKTVGWLISDLDDWMAKRNRVGDAA